MGNQIATTGDGTGRIDEGLDHYSDTNWPKELQIKDLDIFLQKGHAEVKLMDGTTLKPFIPLDQLARFLNDHVQGALSKVTFSGGGEGLEDGVPQLLDQVTVQGRLHTDMLIFLDFFHLPWAGIERILDGRTLCAKAMAFFHLQLPSGEDANKLLELPTVRQCPHLALNLILPQMPGSPPLFDNTALMEWLDQSGHRILFISSDCLSSGYLSFVDALKKDFQQATQASSYDVTIHCPGINGVAGGLGVRDDGLLFNQLGEIMVITVDADHRATARMGHPIEALEVTRFHVG